MLFRQIFFYALIVGLVSGLTLTAVQMWQVVPIIHSAEVFEAEPAPVIANQSAHEHSHGAAHHHDEAAWAPENGAERTGFTLLSNILTAIGFALFMQTAIVMTLKKHVKNQLTMKAGLLWAAAGYSVFFIAPSLGLPPEIPGAAAGPLEMRQMWWLGAVICTAAGLGGFAFIKSHWRWATLSLILIPHLVGAPQSPGEHFAEQPVAAAAQLLELADQFIGATALANAAFWLVLGLVSVWSVRRISSTMGKPFENDLSNQN